MKTIRIIAALILLIIAINAIVAGYLFITDPTGGSLHISTDRLLHSPFKDFFIPGLVLFLVNGVFNFAATLFIMFRWKYYVQVLFIQSTLLLGWIVIQMIMLQDFNMLHAVFLITGILLLLFSLQLNRHENQIRK